MIYSKKGDGVYYDSAKGRTYVIRQGQRSIHWSRQMLDDMRRLFPVTRNEELAGYLGVSQRTMVRKAREMGLEKNREWLRRIWMAHVRMAHMESRRKGYPGGFQKGVRANPMTEFKPGRKEPDDVKAKRIASLKRYYKMHPGERSRIMKEYWIDHPEEAKVRAQKASETKRLNRIRKI